MSGFGTLDTGFGQPWGCLMTMQNNLYKLPHILSENPIFDFSAVQYWSTYYGTPRSGLNQTEEPISTNNYCLGLSCVVAALGCIDAVNTKS